MATKKKKTKPVKSVVTPTKKRKGRPQTNQKSLANLKPPWKPGDPSPNPSGRPKLLGESYKEWLAAVNKDGLTNAQSIAISIGLSALAGEVGAAREIRSATEEEKPAQHTGEIIFRIVRDERRVPDPPQTAAS